MMRILYHHRTQAEDAQGIHIYEMVKAFRELGHEVEIIALVDRDAAKSEKVQTSLWNRLQKIVPGWFYELMSLTYNVYGYYRLAQAIKAKKPDLIYERYSLNTFCGIWASRCFGIPIVLEVNLPLYYELSRFGKLAFRRFSRFSERWICSSSTITMTVSQTMKNYFVREGVPQEKIAVMHNAVDTRLFYPSISDEVVRDRYNLHEHLVVGFVGWFREWHGLEKLVEIMHEAGLADRGIKLLFVGDGPAYRSLYDMAQKYDLLSSVVFTGSVERIDIPLHIAAMDIAVLPKTNDYGCPMKIIEYMAMKKCIVAPDLSVIRELISHNKTGILFTMDDKNALKAALLHLIENPGQRAELGRNAYQSFCEREYLWQANARRTMALVFGESYIKKEKRWIKKEMSGEPFANAYKIEHRSNG